MNARGRCLRPDEARTLRTPFWIRFFRADLPAIMVLQSIQVQMCRQPKSHGGGGSSLSTNRSDKAPLPCIEVIVAHLVAACRELRSGNPTWCDGYSPREGKHEAP